MNNQMSKCISESIETNSAVPMPSEDNRLFTVHPETNADPGKLSPGLHYLVGGDRFYFVPADSSLSADMVLPPFVVSLVQGNQVVHTGQLVVADDEPSIVVLSKEPSFGTNHGFPYIVAGVGFRKEQK